ncbi:16S rRNA (cytosine(1402)-N(4))-methyltransferase RsmH [Mycoplasma tauri]|uniref:Ribosomal RNA small subunit methyltransferase H n=1 Tax=Mycoplasma tauri TaxID=547987 RepID=A0A953NGK8_9MOLU|nr:16S rRNA (cytosine(1402)-N(4))-methyltransferase RsmH [Mycoplasma tauri]MBZ4195639.1 16S rRNA (cytosine(1402)-N(4))-methyltransferase RsmH [Mycoplasma tauri]MBZ4218534.1 16S rRNA (cytosine(1402)-N(4))-methyltransferase RsmH [Mycoplasma tauri]QSB07264.1 16S rRNA (cytosine(1402)-N(4))-methyltransferase RsmH [Mycoplasma tauri]
MQNEHKSVMLDEVINSLKIKPNGIYLDLTLGMGGHSSKILKMLTNGYLIGFDKDNFAIEESRKRLEKINNNFHLIHSDFANIKEELEKMKITSVDGIIADLGISSPQVDNGDRGFSYNKDSRLDMRMDSSQELDAEFIVNNYEIDRLVKIFNDYAEVKLSHKVANAIINNRPIKTTLELVNIIKKAYPAKLLKEKNPAKAVFQAIRIEVNNEFDSIKTMLNDAISFLKPGASLAVISFHSLEDKIVKSFFGQLTKNKLPSKLPVNEVKQYSVKVYNPSKNELVSNNRARSAKLRVLTKIF